MSKANRFFRMVLAYEDGVPGVDSDIKAIADGYISLSPLGLDLTATESLGSLAAKLGELPEFGGRSGRNPGESG